MVGIIIAIIATLVIAVPVSAYVANTRTNIYETLRSPSFKGNERFKNLVVDKEYTTKQLGF